MGSLWEEMENDGPEFLSTFGRPITFRGKDDKGIINRTPISSLMDDGGITYSAMHTVRVFAPIGSDYRNNPPLQGEFITFFGQRHTILSTVIRFPSPWVDVNTQVTENA